MSRDWNVWKTIKLGTGIKDGAGLRKAIEASGMKISKDAIALMFHEDFTVSPEVVEVDLVRLSVADLGFEPDEDYHVICDAARGSGLQLCPAEVGPQLRLQYTDQPYPNRVTVAMRAIPDLRGALCTFCVLSAASGLHLYVDYGEPDDYFWDCDEFVFVLPRK
jgi:hypothetical protein